MSTLQATTLLVKCPHCGNKFTPEDAIGHDIRLQLEKEFEGKLEANAKTVAEMIRKQENEKYRSQVQLLENDRKLKLARLKELESIALAAQQKEMEIRSREENLDLEMKRKLLEREKLIREQAEKTALEKAEMSIREREQLIQREREMLSLQLKKKVQEEADRVREEERMRNAE
ncbi:hypothetical protein, partial [Chryseosolibacter indicus]